MYFHIDNKIYLRMKYVVLLSKSKKKKNLCIHTYPRLIQELYEIYEFFTRETSIEV